MSVWEQVPTLSTTEALCLLAMDHLAADGRTSFDYVEVDEVAGVTGLSTSTAGAALRALRAKDLLAAGIAYLDVDRRGRDIARRRRRLLGHRSDFLRRGCRHSRLRRQTRRVGRRRRRRRRTVSDR